jgi:YVTN family beta-propeller protein
MAMQTLKRSGILVALASAFLVLPASAGDSRPANAYPVAVAVSPDGGTIYVSDATAGRLVIADAKKQAVRAEIALQGKPQGMCLSADGRLLYVAERGAGTVAIIDTSRAAVVGRIAAGRWPVAVALNSERLFVCNQYWPHAAGAA